MQILDQYRDKKVCILGFGIEGKATFDYLRKHGITPAICDAKSKATLLTENPDIKGIEISGGDGYLESLKNYDVVFKTPGVKSLQSAVENAILKGVIFTSQIEFFFDNCPCKIIGVTGTKGKGTTSTLIYEMLKKSGRDVYLGGNIGTPAISFLDKLKEDSVVVLELSSFQLQALRQSPDIAVVLNITSEHLDYHKDTAEYRDAKANIVRFQDKNDIAIFNADCKVPSGFERLTSAQKYYFSKEKKVKGCFVDASDNIVLNLADVQILAKFSQIQLRGRHNLENITAASLASALLGVSHQVISNVIRSFKGLEHRLEFVRELDEIKYYNDSFSTVPETAIAALRSFDAPKIVILGGSDKGSDYTELGKTIFELAPKALIMIGQMAERIDSFIPKSYRGEKIFGLKTMQEIVKKARELATAGDVVLLSPACASKDMFKNYKDRGDQFKSEVAKL